MSEDSHAVGEHSQDEPFSALVPEGLTTSKGEEPIKGNLDTNMAAAEKGSKLSFST